MTFIIVIVESLYFASLASPLIVMFGAFAEAPYIEEKLEKGEITKQQYEKYCMVFWIQFIGSIIWLIVNAIFVCNGFKITNLFS